MEVLSLGVPLTTKIVFLAQCLVNRIIPKGNFWDIASYVIGSERRRFLWKFKDDDNDQEWRAMVNDYSSIIFCIFTQTCVV